MNTDLNFDGMVKKLITSDESTVEGFLQEIKNLKKKRVFKHRTRQNVQDTIMSMKPEHVSIYEFKLNNVLQRKYEQDEEDRMKKQGLLTKWDIYRE